MGAKKIITLDLNPYLKRELLIEAINYIKNNEQKVESLMEGYILADRFQTLINTNFDNMSLKKILSTFNIEYLAPCDARSLAIPNDSIDYYTSCTVLEHIDPQSLKEIIKESKRVIKKEGLVVHRIDYSDHFSHSDKEISAINFLKYSHNQCKRQSNHLLD